MTKHKLQKAIGLIIVIIGSGTTCLAIGHDLEGIRAERLILIPTSTGSASNHPPAPSNKKYDLSTAGNVQHDKMHAALKFIQDQDHALAIASALINEPSSNNIYGLHQADIKRIKAVIMQAKTWNPGTKIKVCFYEKGGEAAKSAITKQANEWANNGNIKFDFGIPPHFRNCSSNETSNIRITFRTDGHWSLLGTDSMHYDQSVASMGLKDFDSHDSSDPEFIRIVLHEFGHALGFHHEHQTPAAACESQMDKEKIKETYPQLKNDEEIRVNFQKISVSSSFGLKNGFEVGESPDGPVVFTSYDPKSIMHYSLPFKIFKEPLPTTGSCFVPPSYQLSQMDIQGMKAAYPSDDPRNSLQLRRQAINELINDPRFSDMQKAAFSALKK